MAAIGDEELGVFAQRRQHTAMFVRAIDGAGASLGIIVSEDNSLVWLNTGKRSSKSRSKAALLRRKERADGQA
jgi:hypothetical protein